MRLTALLLILSCLGLHTFWQAQAVPILSLGLAPDTFDDAYVGCAEEMEEKAATLLKEEMARHALLRESWEAAQGAWEQKQQGLTLPPGFKSQHGIAVMVYTNSSNTLYWELNQALRTGGGSREFYMRHFPFKALHFYLTRALQLLQGSKGCSRGPGQVVFRGEREVLIPPHEVFLVTRFSQDGARSLVTLWSYNKTCSNFNCAYLGGEKRQGCVSAPTVGAARLTLQQGLLSALLEDPALSPRGVPALRSWALESPMPAT
ncbi:ecto-ADP-ribosyltransferase 5 isoform X4 [Pteronotus mesoamericanus]|uniref:ecto-ADP-ribosyltransferase 5 isoform X4 n=1 Tax=Pteronotus mesoamericanus TaxID=1884717 RepID=UPI0023ED076B|nr:ecto-ADP-ribosyltransferase 5 isoform X4 [Pteronotus parnellii mesoamericanus]